MRSGLRVSPALRAAAVAALALAAAWAHGHGGGAGLAVPAFVTYRGTSMATTIAVTLPAGPAAEAHARTVLAVFDEVEARMSEWKDTSPLAAVNRAAGVAPVAVPADLRGVLARAKRIGDATDGAFDVTWAALWGLWDFQAAAPRLPPPAEVARRAALVDYRQLEIDADAGTVYLPRPGMLIGLGGIAKGHALDRAAAVLARRGVDDWLIAAGGQVMARGTRAGRPWTVGIRDPRGGPDDVFARVPVRDASLSTSADSESYFVVDGVRYHHVLDPRTGWPARGLRSATVVSPDATLADALSTALVVLGPERALEVAARLGVEAVLVDEAGRVAVTAGLAEQLEVVRAPAAE